ncbi:hypothetical protein ACIQD3_18985 [Peribacillus loiseleuriae]|uniref:hypothetical protein n=1 Tax=Peribacillus loiseleuriae TaxID=1679170 RepID=UPI000A5596D9|nr:hypothetical protein [Peribacillus loiseleuriae]
MKYKIRVFQKNSNEETIIVADIFNSLSSAEAAIEKLESKYPDMYDYVKVPVQ